MSVASYACGQVQLTRQVVIAAEQDDVSRVDVLMSRVSDGALWPHAAKVAQALNKAIGWARVLDLAYKHIGEPLGKAIANALPFGRVLLIVPTVEAVERCGKQATISKETAINICVTGAVARRPLFAEALESAIKESPRTGPSSEQCKKNALEGIKISQTAKSEEEIVDRCEKAAESAAPKLEFDAEDKPGPGAHADFLFDGEKLF